MSDVTLHIDGRVYLGWESVQIVRSLEQAAGSFSLEVSEHWSGQAEAWPIREEDACQVKIDGEVVIDGQVDVIEIDLSGQSRRVAVKGSDGIATLTSCSADLTQWTYKRADVLVVAQRVAAPFGIAVSADPGLELPRIDKLVINPGDTAYEAIESAARTAGVLVVSDGAGGLRLTRSATTRAGDRLVEGDNIKRMRATYDASKRYRRYKVVAQNAGTDNASGHSARAVSAEAIDEGVRRTSRVKVLRARTKATLHDARRRADWAARMGAARSQRLSVTVNRWRQRTGPLWRVNLVVPVTAPAVRVDGDLLVSLVEYSLSSSGELTRLDLVRPDAYTPEPELARVRGAAGTATGWPELVHGVQR